MRTLALLLCLTAARVALGDEAFATTAFEQAEALRKQGDWKAACNLYKASYDADPQLGVLLHLANCNEQIGRIASAWALFTDAIDFAHRTKDARETLARTRADRLAPRISKLRIVAPVTRPPGLVVKRGGTDVTSMLGGEMPIDPGEYTIVASAPGFVEWTTKVRIEGEGRVVDVTLAELQPRPEPPPDAPGQPPPVPEETRGTLRITTTPQTATIVLDGVRVGIGRFDGPIDAGQHTVQVVAAGMQRYQSEIDVIAGKVRVMPVLLVPEPKLAAEPSARFVFGASVAPGIKLRRDNPNVIAYRAEAAARVGPRTNVGVFVELGSIEATSTCGFDLPAMATSDYDYGTRYQLGRCLYIKPGAQVLVHPLAGRRIDPYGGITPGVRFMFAELTPHTAGVRGAKLSEKWIGYVIGARLGVDFYPTRAVSGWSVGPVFEAEYTIRGQESCDSCEGGNAINTSYTTLLFGVRSSLAF